jgi:hypothetical protein
MQASTTGAYNVLVSAQKRGLLGREMRHCLRGCPFTTQVVGASVSAGGCLVQVINDESPFQGTSRAVVTAGEVSFLGHAQSCWLPL